MGNATWSLDVEDFGPIKRASVTLAPLTVFVGQNSSGKSYLASLFWALLNAQTILLQPELVSGAAYAAAKGVVQAIQNGEKNVVTGDDWAKILALINQVLNAPSGNALAEIFAFRDCKAGSIKATLTALPDDLPVRITTDPLSVSPRSHRPRLRTRFSDGVLNFTFPDATAESALDLDLSMLRDLARRLTPRYQPAEYIPAARTGLMLAFKALVASLFGWIGQKAEDRQQLGINAPIRAFLQSVQYADSIPGNPHYPIAKFLENMVLKGQIDRANSKGFYYLLGGADTILPLHATSSLVTEVAPLIVLLKQGINGTLIFEEPEAHLHLAAQRSLACALVRLVNTGTPVLITTHSDTFLQQINILMQLHNHPDRDVLAAEFGYETADFLDPAKARGYIFDPTNGKTTVREMRKTAEGFVEPLMNQTIADLTREVLRMESC